MDDNLILLKKGVVAKEIPLPGAVTVIGRRSECDLCIPLKAVSRKHCQLNTDGGKLKIRNLNSSHGTMVNGRSVEEATIQPGDSIPQTLYAAVAEVLAMIYRLRHRTM